MNESASPFTTAWLNPSILSNITSAVSRLAHSQKVVVEQMKYREENLAKNVDQYLKKIATRIETSVEKKFNSITSDVSKVRSQSSRSQIRLDSLEKAISANISSLFRQAQVNIAAFSNVPTQLPVTADDRPETVAPDDAQLPHSQGNFAQVSISLVCLVCNRCRKKSRCTVCYNLLHCLVSAPTSYRVQNNILIIIIIIIVIDHSATSS